MRRKSLKGFTLVELLVTIGIIGIIATVTVVSVNSARVKARDAARFADIKAIQTSLALYYSDKEKYPQGEDKNLSPILGQRAGAAAVLCDTDAGLQKDNTGCGTTYMARVPGDPLSKEGSQYEFTYTPADDLQSYTINFSLEAKAGSLAAGGHKATSSGLQ